MSHLSEIMERASDSTRPVADAVRQVKILGFRINSETLSDWAEKELVGYSVDDDLPRYRKPRHLPVTGTWRGRGSQRVEQLSTAGIPKNFLDAHFSASFTHSISEMESIAAASEDPVINWDPYTVEQYVRFVDSKIGGVSYQYMSLMRASLRIPRYMVIGALDAIRSRIVDLCLELEKSAPESGTLNGPTRADSGVRDAEAKFYFNIYGDNANIATGDHNSQRSDTGL